tara:strand:- start:1523 stop:1756 length:234 start_codon:yes stop_codon:yes gene_type:complete
MLKGFVKGNKIEVDSLQLFLMVVLVFFIKVFLVQWSYNRIFPVLRYNVVGHSERNFRPLTFLESIVVVILFNNLFSR